MTSDRIARDYLRQAHARRIALDALFAASAHPAVVRESQEIVELVLKGALRFVGVDPPKRHDVHRVLEQFIERFPPAWRQTVEDLRDALDRLVQDRGPAFYGNEAEDIPASELFGEADARRAMTVAERLLDLYTRLLGEERANG
ncbi:MAG: HEPN domain-containing protein [Candidatus Rokuibacteriota bacterium]